VWAERGICERSAYEVYKETTGLNKFKAVNKRLKKCSNP